MPMDQTDKRLVNGLMWTAGCTAGGVFHAVWYALPGRA